jgi:hypothetical protein
MTFTDCLTTLQTQYERLDFSNEILVSIWREALAGIQVYAVGQAIREWIRTQKWPPTPSEIRKRAIELETPDATGDQPLPPDAPGFWVATLGETWGWQRVTPAEVVG